MKQIRPILLLTSAVSFGLGISMPLMKFEKLWLFSETPSLLGIISDLWIDNEILLAVIVLAFSILFPLAKLTTVFQAVFKGGPAAVWATALAKWSMMDVLLVAIVIFAAKTSGLASAFTQPGLWFFALSAVTVTLASIGLKQSR
ncbi:MAG: paraquat-inducible protein A [Rhizobiaceae bacterium]|nr:paraquat-inducible protein A [Rhizobiaceae bacterium]